MSKYLLFIALLISTTLWAQKLDKSFLTVSLNKGIGFSYHNSYYYYNSDGSRHKVPYSAGGGVGIEIQYGKYFSRNISVSLAGGYQQILALPGEEDNDRVLASFNYLFFSLSTDLTILKTDKLLKEVSIGGAGLFADAGKLRRVEEDLKRHPIKYGNSYGWQLQTSVELDPLNTEKIRPFGSLSYRNLSYSDLSANTPAPFRQLRGDGLFLKVGVKSYF